MSLQDGDNNNSLYFNPFAGSSQASFSSALKTTTESGGSIGTRPGFRRRGSEGSSAKRSRTDHDPQDGEDIFGSVHARSQTTDAVFGSSSSTKFHPLQAPLARTSGGSSSSISNADTRPRLKRLMSNIGPSPAGKDDSTDEDEAPPSRSNAALKEKVVIVHEVTPTDSFAGVALKYGISMADLRKANTLWPSDPIHIRNILYIPLDRSHKAKEILLSRLESNSTDAILPEDDPTTSTLTTDTDDATTLSSSSSLTIRRIPISQLSYFPPPSTSLHPSATIASSRTVSHSSTSSRKRDPIPFESAPSSSSAYSVSSSLPSTSAFASALQAPPPPTPPRAPIPSLTSLFSALPIGRISYESNASTPSQGSDEQLHELDDVSRSSSSRNGQQRHLPRQQDYLNSQRSPQVSKPSSRPFDGFELGPFPSSAHPSSSKRQNSSKRSEASRSQQTIHYTSPDTYLSTTDVIRTSQPERSPSMQLPLKPRRDP